MCGYWFSEKRRSTLNKHIAQFDVNDKVALYNVKVAGDLSRTEKILASKSYYWNMYGIYAIRLAYKVCIICMVCLFLFGLQISITWTYRNFDKVTNAIGFVLLILFVMFMLVIGGTICFSVLENMRRESRHVGHRGYWEHKIWFLFLFNFIFSFWYL